MMRCSTIPAIASCVLPDRCFAPIQAFDDGNKPMMSFKTLWSGSIALWQTSKSNPSDISSTSPRSKSAENSLICPDITSDQKDSQPITIPILSLRMTEAENCMIDPKNLMISERGQSFTNRSNNCPKTNKRLPTCSFTKVSPRTMQPSFWVSQLGPSNGVGKARN